MTTVLINGAEFPVTTPEMGFRDFITTVSNELSKDAKVIARITIDGHEVTEEAQNAIAATPLNSFEKLEILASTPADMAYETLDTLEIYVDRLCQTVERSASLYKAKNYITADTYFLKSLDGLDLLVQTISGVKMALRMGSNNKIALIEAALASAMSDLLVAKRENNYVMLADLLENDLLENLKEWREVGFPAFRAWKTS